MPTASETRAKAAAFDQMVADLAAKEKADKRTAALQCLARTGTPEAAGAKRILAREAAAAKAKADGTAVLPHSIDEAEGDARRYSKADMLRQAARSAGAEPTGDAAKSRANMEALVRSRGQEPVERGG